MNKTITELLKMTWQDESMVKHCLKSTTYIDMGDYYLNLSSKPTISKTIHYSDVDYSTGGMAKDPGTGWNVFYNTNINLNSSKHWIEKIENNEQQIVINTNYSNDKTNGLLKSWTTKRWHEDIRNGGRVATEAEKEIILEGLKLELVKYETRLKRYFKRYGKHIRTNSYWADR